MRSDLGIKKKSREKIFTVQNQNHESLTTDSVQKLIRHCQVDDGCGQIISIQIGVFFLICQFNFGYQGRIAA